MTGTAIRTYHSADDPTVPVAGTRAMVAAVEAAGGNVEYTEYTNLGHGCWATAFNQSDLVTWMFDQARSSKFPFYGDTDVSGTVNAADALLALQHAVGKIQLTCEDFEVTDVTRDGVIDAVDALKILQYSVGIVSEL